MNLHQRAEFECLLSEHTDAAIDSRVYAMHHGHFAVAKQAHIHNTRCDLIIWIEQNVESSKPLSV